MKGILFVLLVMLAVSCKEGPYLKHTLAFKNTVEECTGGMWNYKLTSNTNGERYEFSRCLPNTYNGQYTLVRNADTIRVTFPVDTSMVARHKYAIILDVDTWPKYSHIYLGNELLKLGQQ